MARNKTDYFELMEQQIALCADASDLLSGIIKGFSPDTVAAEKQKMHEIENKGDTLRHDIRTRLTREFITPIDQEDILSLVQIIDDVTDAIDEVVIELYMFHIDELPQEAITLANTVNRCVKALQLGVKELKNFKKADKLHDLLIDVNTIEGEADAIYIEAIHKLFCSDMQYKKIFGCKAIYDCLENCCDLCEHATDVIEQIIIKNA